jgi:cytoskeletal protein CcmA (bactofilin family)
MKDTQPNTSRLVPHERLSAITSLMAVGAHFDGSFHSAKDIGIKIDGRLNGNVIFDAGGTIHIGVSGQVENTKLEADYIFIEGKITGVIIARKALEISGTATLVGDVSYHQHIDIHSRARIRGKVEFQGDLDSAQPSEKT